MKPSYADRRLRMFAVVLGLAAVCPPAAAAEVIAAERLIDAYRLEEAARQVPGERAKTAAELYVQGKFLFFSGDYAGAEPLLLQAIERNRTELDWKYLREQVRISAQMTAAMVETQFPDGRMVFFHEDGPDSLLVSYAAETLLAQGRALKALLGDEVPQIRVYIVPTVEKLSDLCGLPVEQIEATGTVAVTRYNRIMLLSPRAVLNGYPWLDTLAHELVHMSVSRVSMNEAPIWLHEGVAKILESRWRDGLSGNMPPESAWLLDRAAREGRLLPLRKFHPSVSWLPSQEDAALAYAQVQSFLAWLENRYLNNNGLRHLLERLAGGRTVEAVLKELTGYEMKKLYRWWQEQLRGTRQAPAEMVPLMKRRYLKGESAPHGLADAALSDDARRYLRIGDLLRLRGHTAAAVEEYSLAMQGAEGMVPDVFDRLTGALLELQRNDEALSILEKAQAYYPWHSPVFLHLAQVFIRRGDRTRAEAHLRQVIALNPFHPDVHCLLADVYRGHDEKRAAMEKEHCLLIGKKN